MPHNAATRVVFRAAGSFLVLTAGLVAAGEVVTGEARPSSARCFVAGCHTTSTQQRLRLPRPLPRSRVVVPILMYHRINVASPGAPAITRRLTVHPADFACQMRWLRRRGYQTVTQRELFDALMHGRSLGRRPIMITFDDGYRDVFYKATPVLTKLGMQGTAYVISDRVVNGDRTFLSPGLLRALEHRGVEIGSHSVSHSDLTQLSDRELLAELMGSRPLPRAMVAAPGPVARVPIRCVRRTGREAGATRRLRPGGHHGGRHHPVGRSTARSATTARSGLDRRRRAREAARRRVSPLMPV